MLLEPSHAVSHPLTFLRVLIKQLLYSFPQISKLNNVGLISSIKEGIVICCSEPQLKKNHSSTESC